MVSYDRLLQSLYANISKKMQGGFPVMLEVSNLSFSFRNQPILDNLNFDVASGEIVGLVAPNGTGKSTLLQNLTGLLVPKTGTVTLNGHSLQQNRTAYLHDMFFLADNRSLYAHLTAIEQVTYIQQMWRSAVSPDDIINLLDMTAYRKKRINKMSLGMRQHVLLACYLASNAPMMFFDEPLNGLDPTSIQRFTQIFTGLRQIGRAHV